MNDDGMETEGGGPLSAGEWIALALAVAAPVAVFIVGAWTA